jgi:pimeloyl-ACP methyl ester carboxylesterase
MAERVDVNGVTLAYEDSGQGPAVVFVHGLGGSIETWRAQTAAVGDAGFRTIAYDQRGAGLSAKPEGPLSAEQWTADLIALVDSRGLDRVALVGNSVGCMVAANAAAELGERCWALVTIGGALAWRPEAGPVFAERVKLARAGRMDEIADTVVSTGISEARGRADPAFGGLFRSLIAGASPAAYAECSAATAEARMTAPERVSAPALAIAGELDPVTPPAFAEAIAAAIGGGETASIAGAAHWCHLEAPDAVNEAILGFLDAHRPA